MNPPAKTTSHHWSAPIGRVAGVTIRVHATFLLLVALFVLAGLSSEGPGVPAALGWLVAIFACVVVHELAHSLVAIRRGVRVREIVLLPIGGVSRMERLPESPADELAIAIVGPLASFGLAVMLGAFALLTGSALWPIDLVDGAFIARLAWVNLILGAFNLLPAFPLDGGRVFRALLERRYDLEGATRRAARAGRTLAIGLAVIGAFVNVWLVFIALFIYFGAYAEEAATVTHLRLHGHVADDVMLLEPVVLTEATTVAVARDLMRRTAQRVFPVTGAGGRIATVDAGALATADPRSPVGTVATPVRVVAPDADLEDAVVPIMREDRSGAVPVVERGRIVGLVTTDDLAALVAERAAARRTAA